LLDPASGDSTSGQNFWHMEYMEPGLIQGSQITRVVFDGQSAYQATQIIDTTAFGRTLVLDGKVQSSEVDEWVYHEALVQPVMLAHAAPKRVFIGGGGEGATAREVLRHKSVTECVMVDLDEEVVGLCKEHLPNHHQGAFDDPRLTVLFADAIAYLRDNPEPFDVLIIDVPDPLEGGPAYLLYTQEFYAMAASRLAPGGIIVTQSGPCGPTNVREVFSAINKTMGAVLGETSPYRVYIPSFGTMWGFIAAGLPDAPSVARATVTQIDERVATRLSAPPLKYYDGVAHQGMVSLPKYLRAALDTERRIITDATPLYAV
jgi:spermidine synthase